MTTISAVLTADHRRGDELFAAVVEAAGAADWSASGERLGRFVRALERHLEAEEQVLFPAFEEATGMRAGPTQVMRHEHGEMKARLDAIAALLAAGDAGGLCDEVDAFEALMASHSAKEERILYPMCDQALSELDGEDLAKMLA